MKHGAFFARLLRAVTLSAALVALIAVRVALAQGWPAPSGQPVDDRAGVITAEAAAGLNATLAALQGETGIAIAVVTLPTREGLPAAATLADFTRAFFNARGIGAADRNDGILIVLVMDERAVQITLGAGYHSGHDVIAQDIVNRWFLPELRKGDVAAALRVGVDQTIARIARRPAEGLAPGSPKPPAPVNRGIWPALALAGIATLAFLHRRRRRRQRGENDAMPAIRDRDRDRDDGPHDRGSQADASGRNPGAPATDDRGSGGRSSGGGAGGRW